MCTSPWITTLDAHGKVMGLLISNFNTSTLRVWLPFMCRIPSSLLRVGYLHLGECQYCRCPNGRSCLRSKNRSGFEEWGFQRVRVKIARAIRGT